MKRTKNMVFNITEESRELFLYTTNDGDLYRHMITPIINNLRKKAAKGIYEKEKAVYAYYNVATEASKKYERDFGYRFGVADRFTVAVEMADYYEEETFYNI